MTLNYKKKIQISYAKYVFQINQLPSVYSYFLFWIKKLNLSILDNNVNLLHKCLSACSLSLGDTLFEGIYYDFQKNSAPASKTKTS